MIKKLYFYDLMDAETTAERFTMDGYKIYTVTEENGEYVLIYSTDENDDEEA